MSADDNFLAPPLSHDRQHNAANLLRLVQVVASPYAQWLRDDSLERDLAYLRRYGHGDDMMGSALLDQKLESPNSSIPRRGTIDTILSPPQPNGDNIEEIKEHEAQTPSASPAIPSPKFFSCLKDLTEVLRAESQNQSPQFDEVSNAIFSESETRLKQFIKNRQLGAERYLAFDSPLATPGSKIESSPHRPHESRFRSPKRPSPNGPSADTIDRIQTSLPVLQHTPTNVNDRCSSNVRRLDNEEVYMLLEDAVFRQMLSDRLQVINATPQHGLVSPENFATGSTGSKESLPNGPTTTACALSDTLAQLADLARDYETSRSSRRVELDNRRDSATDQSENRMSYVVDHPGDMRLAEADYQLAITPPRHLDAVLSHSRNHSFPSRGVATSNSSFGDSGGAIQGAAAARTSSLTTLLPLNAPEPIQSLSFRTHSNVSGRGGEELLDNSKIPNDQGVERTLELGEDADEVNGAANTKRHENRPSGIGNNELSITELRVLADSQSGTNSKSFDHNPTPDESPVSIGEPNVLFASHGGTRAGGSGGGGVSLPPVHGDLLSDEPIGGQTAEGSDMTNNSFVIPVPSNGRLTTPQRGVGRASMGQPNSEEKDYRTPSTSPATKFLELPKPQEDVTIAKEKTSLDSTNTTYKPIPANDTSSTEGAHIYLTDRKETNRTFISASSESQNKKRHHSLLVQIRAAHFKEILQLMRTESARRYQIEMEEVQVGPSQTDMGRRALLQSHFSISPHRRSMANLIRSLGEEEQEDRCLILAEETTKILQLHRLHIEAVMQIQNLFEEDTEQIIQMENGEQVDYFVGGTREQEEGSYPLLTSLKEFSNRQEQIALDEDKNRYALSENERSLRVSIWVAAIEDKKFVDDAKLDKQRYKHMDYQNHNTEPHVVLVAETPVAETNRMDLDKAIVLAQQQAEIEAEYKRIQRLQDALCANESEARSYVEESEALHHNQLERLGIDIRKEIYDRHIDRKHRRNHLEEEEAEMRVTETHVEASRRLRIRLLESEERELIIKSEARRLLRQKQLEEEELHENRELQAAKAQKAWQLGLDKLLSREIENRLEIEVDTLANFDQIIKQQRAERYTIDELIARQTERRNVEERQQLEAARQSLVVEQDQHHAASVLALQRQFSEAFLGLSDEEERQRIAIIQQENSRFVNILLQSNQEWIEVRERTLSASIRGLAGVEVQVRGEIVIAAATELSQLIQHEREVFFLTNSALSSQQRDRMRQQLEHEVHLAEVATKQINQLAQRQIDSLLLEEMEVRALFEEAALSRHIAIKQIASMEKEDIQLQRSVLQIKSSSAESQPAVGDEEGVNLRTPVRVVSPVRHSVNGFAGHVSAHSSLGIQS